MLFYSFIASVGFSLLYAGAAYAHGSAFLPALAVGVIVIVLFAAGFLAPPYFLHYTDADQAPRVMSQVVARAGVGTVLVLVADAVTWFGAGRAGIALLEELYVYTLLAFLLFHGFGGAIASHVVYLQRTKQYNSNQLVAVLVFVTLLLLTLTLYFLAFDYFLPRDAYIHLRDLLAVTMILVGYGRAVYLMAHH